MSLELKILNAYARILNVILVTFKELNSGGAERDRTADLLLAKQALSQLSYSPDSIFGDPLSALCMVGLGRIELPTSRLSGVRSNHLSYWPGGEAARSLETEPYAPDARFDLSGFLGVESSESERPATPLLLADRAEEAP